MRIHSLDVWFSPLQTLIELLLRYVTVISLLFSLSAFTISIYFVLWWCLWFDWINWGVFVNWACDLWFLGVFCDCVGLELFRLVCLCGILMEIRGSWVTLAAICFGLCGLDVYVFRRCLMEIRVDWVTLAAICFVNWVCNSIRFKFKDACLSLLYFKLWIVVYTYNFITLAVIYFNLYFRGNFRYLCILDMCQLCSQLRWDYRNLWLFRKCRKFGIRKGVD